MNRKNLLVLILLVGMLLLPLFATSVSASGICTNYHTVQRGDTLSRIARTYSTTVARLQTMNNIANANRIEVGQVLCVVVQEQQTTTYTVQRGDTLSRIARSYGIDMYVLARLNNITNLNRINVGQVLTIPSLTIQ